MFAGKTHENRDWPSNYRGHIAIHASAKSTYEDRRDAMDLFESIRGRKLEGLPEYEWWTNTVSQAGVILGTVYMDGCVTSSDSPWFFGEYGFVLRDPRPLKVPIPILGKLGFWTLPEDIEQRIVVELGDKL